MLKGAVKIPIGYHGHNNLALSAANTLAADKGGADILDCGLMGMEVELVTAPTKEDFERENDCDAIILRGIKMPQEVIERFSFRLKLIMRWGAGFGGADIISLHVPLTEENHHMINAAAIAGMKTGAIVINAARGGLMDDAAVLEAVNNGKLAGAGIDCAEDEARAGQLVANPNIIVTPHIGGGVADIGDNIIPMIVENVKALKEERPRQWVVNKA